MEFFLFKRIKNNGKIIFLKIKKSKCSLLVVHKEKSFDKFFKGDFNLENNLISRKEKSKLNYIYTGLQIINPDVFSGLRVDVFFNK